MRRSWKGFFCTLLSTSLFLPAKAQDSLTVHPTDSLPAATVSKKHAAFSKTYDSASHQLFVSYKGTVVAYGRPKLFGFITNVPNDLWQIAKSPFQKQNLVGLAVVVGTTTLLIPNDQQLIDNVKGLSKDIHLHPETNYKVPIKFGTTKILKIPQNLNTALYQLGEGGTSLLLGGGIWVYGKIAHDYRALQTGSDIAEAFISMGLATQLLKRSFGRESPFLATRPGGAWRPFPSFSDYQQNTSNYDAFPSGHLATLMATVTIIALNYPEKKWIKPVGYSVMGLAAWAMMNTEVHWAGDYPLALALGYLSGRITHARHSKPVVRKLEL